MKPTSVSVPAGIATAWRRRARADGITQVDVLVEAISAQREVLPDLVRRHRTQHAPLTVVPPDGLFVRRTSPPSEPFVTVSLRMLSPNVGVLDRLTRECGASSRSQLVASALETWFAQPVDSRAGSRA